MKVKFTHDFRGKLTNELFYREGIELDVEDEIGAELVRLNHAVEIRPPVEKKEPVKNESKRHSSKRND